MQSEMFLSRRNASSVVYLRTFAQEHEAFYFYTRIVYKGRSTLLQNDKMIFYRKP